MTQPTSQHEVIEKKTAMRTKEANQRSEAESKETKYSGEL